VQPDLYPFDSWHEWLKGHDTAFAQVRQHLPTVAAALKYLSRPSPALTPVATHRDIKPDNVLLTVTGPLLLDWDSAGPDTAEHELLRSALAMGFEQQRPFARTIAAYRRAGGRPIRADPALFHGVVDGQLRTAEWLLWRALGHRGDDTATRAQAGTECLARLRGAAKSLRRIPGMGRLAHRISVNPWPAAVAPVPASLRSKASHAGMTICDPIDALRDWSLLPRPGTTIAKYPA
jgi:serine/threonine protein kinase